MENNKDNRATPTSENAVDKKPGENTVMHSDFTQESEQNDQDFPGYPHYPASEDLLNPANSEGRLDLDVDNLSRASKTADLNFSQDTVINSSTDVELPNSPAMRDDEDDLGIVAGTE